jgi:hypothetical protein
MRLRPLAAAVVLLLASPAAQAADLAAHRALYTLTLQSARGDVAAASGTMAYDVQDSCDGWAVRQRLAMTLTDRDGQDIEMLSDYTTWESKDGLRLRFRTRQTTEQAVTTEIAGDARLERAGGKGAVHYTVPEEADKPLPAGTLFPMAHTTALLKAAADGKKFLNLPLFDGTGAEGAQDSSVVILNWGKPAPAASGKWIDLSKLQGGRVHIAFFDRKADAQQPDYEVGMHYFANGVADELAMDFGDFVMKGKLTEFKLQPHPC